MESILVCCRLYLDGLSLELNNIKAECDICEALLNHLMSADDICVFCPSVLQSMLDGCQFKENCMKLFKCSKTVCMTLGAQRIKSVSHYKYLVP